MTTVVENLLYFQHTKKTTIRQKQKHNTCCALIHKMDDEQDFYTRLPLLLYPFVVVVHRLEKN